MNTTQSKPAEKTNKEFKFSGDWSAQSKKLKEEYSQLTDADLKMETGKENEMLSRVASRLGKKREEVITLIRKGQSEKSTAKV